MGIGKCLSFTLVHKNLESVFLFFFKFLHDMQFYYIFTLYTIIFLFLTDVGSSSLYLKYTVIYCNIDRYFTFNKPQNVQICVSVCKCITVHKNTYIHIFSLRVTKQRKKHIHIKHWTRITSLYTNLFVCVMHPKKQRKKNHVLRFGNGTSVTWQQCHQKTAVAATAKFFIQ